VSDNSRDVDTAEPAEAVEDDAGAAETEVDDSATEVRAEADSSPKRTARGRRGWSRPLRYVKVVPLLLVLLLLITGGVTAWLYFDQYQPKRQTDPGVARAVVTAASDGTVALLSYSPESLDKDFANAKSHLSGDFLSYYNEFTEQIVAPAAKQKSLKTIAHVIGAGVSELHPNSAVVLVFVDQSTTSKDKPDPAMAASSVRVSLSRVNGNWLITKFDPV
jgi:Mce-associated membrane protein